MHRHFSDDPLQMVADKVTERLKLGDNVLVVVLTNQSSYSQLRGGQ